MGYSGFTDWLCAKGHLYTQGAYGEETPPCCPTCGATWAWYNRVDTTNGSYDEENGVRIDGYLKLEVREEKKCEHCGHISETTYWLPIDINILSGHPYFEPEAEEDNEA